MDAKAHFSALLAEVEAGGQVAVTRHGKVVACLVLLGIDADTAAH